MSFVPKTGRREILLLALVVTTGIFLRLYHFDTIPFGLNHDGGLESLEAIDLGQNPWPYRPYSIANPWLGETLFRYYLAVWVGLLGPSAWTVKLASTAIGIATLFGFYLLAKKLFGTTAALLALAFLSLSGWHLIMGKSVWRAVSLPFLETLALYFFLKTLETKKAIFAALAGFSLTLTLNTYAASRITPLLFLVFGLIYIVGKKVKLKNLIRPGLVLGVVFGLTILPLAVFAWQHWDVFNSRADYLTVTRRIQAEGSVAPVVENIVRTMTMFTVSAGGDDFFVKEPLLDFPVSYFFLIGVGYALDSWRKLPFQLTLVGFLLTLLPGLTTVPNGNRNIGVLPFVFLLSGLGLWFSYNLLRRSFKKLPIIAYFFVALVFMMTAVTTYNLYLSKNRRELWGFYPETTVVASFMKPKIATTDFYLTDNYPRDALTFLTYQGGSPWVKHYTWLDNGDSFLTVEKQPGKGLAFIMFKADYHQSLIDGLKKKFPDGRELVLPYISGAINRPAAWVFSVD